MYELRLRLRDFLKRNFDFDFENCQIKAWYTLECDVNDLYRYRFAHFGSKVVLSELSHFAFALVLRITIGLGYFIRRYSN